MKVWLNAKAWRRHCADFIILPALLIPFWTATAQTPSTSSTTEMVIAALHTTHDTHPHREIIPSREGKLQSRVAEARHVLLELRAFVEEASDTIELGTRLKDRQMENDRLKMLILNNLAAKDELEAHMVPSKITASSLTKTVIQNWLETVRLKSQSDQADRDLTASEDAWNALEKRVTALKRTLAERRSTLRALRAEGATLSIELGRLHQEIKKTTSDTLRIERQSQSITASTATLRRNVMSKLRSILLESSAR